MRFTKSFIATSILALSLAAVVHAVEAPPIEYPVSFDESDFRTKPWMSEFDWVVVVNRAETGSDQQSIRVYHNQKLVTYEEIADFLNSYDLQMRATRTKDPGAKERPMRIAELATKQWAPGVFKVSTGRNQFEQKGEHHSQHDSWTVTPTGMFVPQAFEPRHKSESYSPKLCDSIVGRVVSAVIRKQLCTYMENAVFFNDGIALHKAIPGTEEALGTKASGGCVRLPGALAEYLFLSLGAATGKLVPVINPDGTVLTDASGQIVRSATETSRTWGTIQARSALVIVENVVK